MPMQRATIDLGDGRVAALWQGGQGSPPLLLLHGGWAGAQAHWSAVWERLGGRHRVVAPELPGIAQGSGDPWTRYEAYVRWLDRLLGRLQLEPAVVVGNSFGATLAWLLALQHPGRCRALVMIDGFPPPELPALLRGLMRWSPLRAGALAHMRRHVYGARALATAFHDPALAPDEIRRRLEQPDDRLIAAMFDTVLASRTPPGRPAQPTLLIWGADDRLPNADVGVGRRLHERWPGSRLVVIERAGHLPQVEQPQAFVDALLPFAAQAAR